MSRRYEHTQEKTGLDMVDHHSVRRGDGCRDARLRQLTVRDAVRSGARRRCSGCSDLPSQEKRFSVKPPPIKPLSQR